MNYNPYAAPLAQPPPPPPGPPGGLSQPWELSEVLGAAWSAVKANWVVLAVAFLVTVAFTAGPGQTPGILVTTRVVEQYSGPYYGMTGGSSLIGIALGSFFRPGLCRMSLAAARGQTPQLADLFSGGRYFLRMLGLQLLLTVGYFVGCACLLVGAIFVMLMFCLADYYIVDADMGVLEAMRASYETTRGQWGDLFLLGLVCFGLTMAGALACCVGVLIAGPVASVALAIVFTRLSGRLASTPAPPPY